MASNGMMHFVKGGDDENPADYAVQFLGEADVRMLKLHNGEQERPQAQPHERHRDGDGSAVWDHQGFERPE